jgi:transcriptional regulator with XRE-family HTH domain
MANKTLDDLLNEFVDAWNAGGRPRVDDFVSKAPQGQGDELAGLIGAFLELAPTPPYTPEQLRELRADPVVRQVSGLIDSPSGLWPTLLPRLRKRAQLTRDQVVERLAKALGVQGREPRVKEYYHQMESGLLDPQGVSSQVLESLAGIFKVSVGEIEAAGDFPFEPGGPASPAYMRSYSLGEIGGSDGVDFDVASVAPPLDEVDELFRGGR